MRLFTIFVSSLLGVLAAFAGNECVWTGGAGDGKWSSAANWTVAPVSGNDDKLIFEGGAIESYNDIEDFSIAGIRTSGEGTKVFNGKTIVLTGQAFPGKTNSGGNTVYCISNACHCVYNADLTINGDARILLDPGATSADFYGDINILKGKVLMVGHSFAMNRDKKFTRTFNFYGDIIAIEGTVQWCAWNQSPINIYGTVDIKSCVFDYQGSYMYFYCNDGYFRVRDGYIDLWYAIFSFRKENVFGGYLPVLNWRTTGGYYESIKSYYNLDGVNQTIDRLGIGRDVSDNIGNAVISSMPATLTMKATASSSTLGIINEKVSIVWDPVSPEYSLFFRKRVSSTEGDIIVNSGSVGVCEGASFSKAKKVHVKSGAAFEVKDVSTVGKALDGLSELCLDNGASLTVSAQGCDMINSSGNFDIHMTSSSILNLPEGFSQKVKQIFVDGVPLSPGVYCGEGSSTGTVISQIKGGGSLVVEDRDNLVYWSNVSGGDWSAGDNWDRGVPREISSVYITKTGPYNVNLEGAAEFNSLLIASRQGPVKLSVSGNAEISKGRMTIATNGVFEVTPTGNVEVAFPSDSSNSTDELLVQEGGKFVSEGRFVTSNLYGQITVAKGGVMQILGGEFIAAPPRVRRNDNALFVRGGTLAVTNATMTLGYDFNSDTEALGDSRSFRSTQGACVSLHNAKVRLNQWTWGTIFGTGRTILSGDTVLDCHNYIRGDFTATEFGETCYVTLEDNAVIKGMQELSICDANGNPVNARAILTLSSPGVEVKDFPGVHVGCENGYGEVNINAGLLDCTGSYGVVLGDKSPKKAQSDAQGCCPTGVVKVTGGLWRVGGRDWGTVLRGMVIGNGVFVSGPNVTSRFNGFVELSGNGTITNTHRLSVGVAYGYGRINVSGGSFVNRSPNPAVIGVAGGEGEWIQSGGTAVFSSDFYVGGSRTNEMKCTNMACEGFWTRNDSKGLLDISGGTLDVGNANMIVSAFGKGEIALSGNGLIKVKNLILSNTVDMVTSQRYIAKIKVKPNSQGNVSLISASGNVVLSEGVSLECDFSEYEGEKSIFPIVSAANIIGAFKTENVVFKGNGANYASLRQTETSIDVVVSRGLIIMVK